MEPVYSRESAVVWGECDPFGLVYYPHMTAWFNDAEHDYLRSIDLAIDDMIATDRTTFVMGSIEFRFIGPAAYGDRVETQLYLERVGAGSVRWRCRIENLTTGGSVAEGTATRVYAHIAQDNTLSARSIPEAMRTTLLNALQIQSSRDGANNDEAANSATQAS